VKVGTWKIRRTHEESTGEQYKVARVISDDDGPSHVETWGYADTHEEAEDLLRAANASAR
jgi:hypothetical protein